MSATLQPRPRPTLVTVPPAEEAGSGAGAGHAEAEPPRSVRPDDDAPAGLHHVDPVIDPAQTWAEAPAALSAPPRRARLSSILRSLADDPRLERVSIGDLVTAMPGRATAALLFLFAAPNAIPTPPGTSALLGLPMIYLSYQLMMRHQPWLPKLLAARSIRRGDFVSLVNRAVPLLQRAERMLRPRMAPLVSPAAEAVIGAFCLLLALSVALPIPLGNMLPAFAVSLLALGVLERDGLWVVIGTITGLASMVVVSGVVWAAIKASVYLVGQVFN